MGGRTHFEGDGRHGEDLRTEGTQEVDLLLRLSIGHEDLALVAPRLADVRQADSYRRIADGSRASGLSSTLAGQVGGGAEQSRDTSVAGGAFNYGAALGE